MKKTKAPVKTKEQKEKELLRIRQENFCKYYVFGVKKEFRMGNATLSYAKAYKLNIRKKEDYETASSCSSRLLRNVKVKDRMRQLIIEAGFNDEVVDARLVEIVTEGSNKDSNVAIKTYNELTKRIDKVGFLIPVDMEKKEELNKALEFLHTARK